MHLISVKKKLSYPEVNQLWLLNSDLVSGNQQIVSWVVSVEAVDEPQV